MVDPCAHGLWCKSGADYSAQQAAGRWQDEERPALAIVQAGEQRELDDPDKANGHKSGHEPQ